MTRCGKSGESRLGRSSGYSINRPGTCRGVAGLRQEAKQIRAIARKTHIACSRWQRVRGQRGHWCARRDLPLRAGSQHGSNGQTARKRAACGLNVHVGVRCCGCSARGSHCGRRIRLDSKAALPRALEAGAQDCYLVGDETRRDDQLAG